MTRLRLPALILLAALRGAAWAACNPIGTEDCCTKIETPECEEVDWPEADGIDVSGTCSSVAFELVGLTPGRYVKKTTVEWIANDPSVECPTNQIRLEEFTFEANVTWRITENGVTVKTGGGTFAESPDPVSGSIGCTFTLSSDAGICGENSEDYSASTNLPVASVSIPSIVGSNDLVEPCEDEVDPVTSVEKLHDDEDDLYQVHWSCSPDPEEVTIWSTTPQKLQIHVDKEGTLAHVYHYPEMSRTEPIWAEGLLRSDVPNDAVVKMLYKVNGVTCETTNACTVVSVDLDKDAYNRMDPFPQVEITQVENLVTGQTATVHYRVLPDLATPEGAVLQATFQVSTEPGTHEWRTPPFRNRFGNEGWDALRYTVYVAENGEKRIRKGKSTPSHKALVEPPPECLATVQTGDALALEADAIFGHLASTPAIQTPRKATGTYPDWKVENIKLFKRTADHYYTNEMVLAELGTTAVREILLGETQDTAVGLELTCDPVVCVNDLYEDGDPGDNAATNQVWTDPDFIGPVALDGIPGCIATGSYQWRITGGANLVIREDDDALFVGKFYEGRYEDGIKYPKIEGRESSRMKDDVEIRFLLQVDPSEENPKAFRGAELPASAKLTVADTRWTAFQHDNVGGRGERRTDMLICDLDLRPMINIQHIEAQNGEPLSLSGFVVSMCDVVRDIRVNGVQVPMSDIYFMGSSVEHLDDDSLRAMAWGLPPPYKVQFSYSLECLETNCVFIEAVGSVSPRAGIYYQFVDDFDDTGSSASASGEDPQSEPPEDSSGEGDTGESSWSDPVYQEWTMETFYRQDPEWDFLYSFEVDHPGSGCGIIECGEGLLCGAQEDLPELYRSELPVVFLPQKAGSTLSLLGPGICFKEVAGLAPVVGRYSPSGGSCESISPLFPCFVHVETVESGRLPESDKWWRGAISETNASLCFVVDYPFSMSGLPDDAELSVIGPNSNETPPATRGALRTGAGGVRPATQYTRDNMSHSGVRISSPATASKTQVEIQLSGTGMGTSKSRAQGIGVVVDLDVDSDNDGTISRDDGFEDSIEEKDPGFLVPIEMTGSCEFVCEAPQGIGGKIVLEKCGGDGRIQIIRAPSLSKQFETTGKIEFEGKPIPRSIPKKIHFVGKDPGQVLLKLSYFADDGQLVSSDSVKILVIPSIAIAPGQNNRAAIWSSAQIFHYPYKISEQLEKAGWVIDYFQDQHLDSDCEQCTLENFKKLKDYGFVFIAAHGNPGSFSPVLFSGDAGNEQFADSWRGSESGMTTTQFWVDRPDKHCSKVRVWGVNVDSSWLVENWQNALNANNAIVVFNSCYSKDRPPNGQSISEASGGRLRFGFSQPAHGLDAYEALEWILTIMNGISPPAPDTSYRKAEKGVPFALNDLREPSNQKPIVNLIRCNGNLNTTLCPAPLEDTPHFPDSVVDFTEGFGCMLLDTNIDSSRTPETMVRSTGGRIERCYWIKRDGTTFGIGFHFKKTGPVMRVEIDLENVKNRGVNGGRRAIPSRNGAISPNSPHSWEF